MPLEQIWHPVGHSGTTVIELVYRNSRGQYSSRAWTCVGQRIKVVPRRAALTAFKLRRCRPGCAETCQRPRHWLYERVLAVRTGVRLTVKVVAALGDPEPECVSRGYGVCLHAVAWGGER